MLQRILTSTTPALLALLVIATACKSENPTLPEIVPEGPLVQARLFTAMFYDGNLEELRDSFSAEMKAALSLSALEAFHGQVEAQLGSETQVLDESVRKLVGLHVYERRAKFENYAGAILLQLSLNDSSVIQGFFIRPEQAEAASDFLEYQAKTDLRLPFDGEWTVFWGGRSISENYHAAVRDQRFAYDIVIARNGSTRQGQVNGNSDYYCFGEPLMAPGSGTIATVVNNVPDNTPGQMNPAQAAGNHLIIDHENGEFSLLAHFQEGSISVAPGSRVAAGQQVGRCGNSGNSSEPHLHYHMQTTSIFGQGDGLPTQFQSYVADGVNVDRGEPVQGQVIRNQ